MERQTIFVQLYITVKPEQQNTKNGASQWFQWHLLWLEQLYTLQEYKNESVRPHNLSFKVSHVRLAP